MKVLQIVPALDAGGVERGTLEVATALVARGHHATVLSGGGALVERLEAMGAEHMCWPIGRKSPLTLRLVGRLRELLRERRFDIVHVRSRVPAWIAVLASRKLPARVRPRFVTTVHGLYSVNRYSAVMLRGERVIAVSETVRRYIEDNYRDVDPARIRVIHRGIDPGDFPYDFRPDAAWRCRWLRQYPELEGRFVVGLPGRITRLKGHRDLLEVIRRLVDIGVVAHGLVVGPPRRPRDRYAAGLASEAQRRGIPVTFAGRRDDMREIYASCDVVLSLSRRPESFGRSVLEALSIGVPVIGYDHGGVGEILHRLHPPGVVPLGDIDRVVEKVCALHRQRVAVASHETFGLAQMLDQTIELYRELHEAPAGT